MRNRKKDARPTLQDPSSVAVILDPPGLTPLSSESGNVRDVNSASGESAAWRDQPMSAPHRHTLQTAGPREFSRTYGCPVDSGLAGGDGLRSPGFSAIRMPFRCRSGERSHQAPRVIAASLVFPVLRKRMTEV